MLVACGQRGVRSFAKTAVDVAHVKGFVYSTREIPLNEVYGLVGEVGCVASRGQLGQVVF